MISNSLINQSVIADEQLKLTLMSYGSTRTITVPTFWARRVFFLEVAASHQLLLLVRDYMAQESMLKTGRAVCSYLVF